MKRKTIKVTAIALTGCLLFSGCGGKTDEAATEPEQVEESVGSTDEQTDVEEVEQEEVTAESGNETPVDDAEVGTTTVGYLDFDEEAFDADEATDHQFGDLSYIAKMRDMRETTGLDSTSTEDVWSVLNEDGLLITEGDGYDEEMWQYGVSGYTGRFAYPKVTESDVTKDFYLYDWTDLYCSYICDIGEGDNAILFTTGYDTFNDYVSADIETQFTFERFKDIEVNGDTYEVWTASADESSITYMYKLGGFAIVVELVGEDMSEPSEDAIAEYIACITL